jgi:hypothetical protein
VETVIFLKASIGLRAEGYRMVKFFIQRSLRRGNRDNRLGLALFVMLLAVLLASVYHGVRSLTVM